eukprot:jgi/Picsp_1/2124/NSC_05589-R1_ubiquitin-protein ligase 1
MKLEIPFQYPESVISERVLTKIQSLMLDEADVKDIGRAVKGFAWEHDKCSIFEWAALLNKLDDFLAYCTKEHLGKLLDATVEDPLDELPVSEEDVVSALCCTRVILENSVGREAYASLEYLADLLSSSSMQLRHETLKLLRVVFEKSFSDDRSPPPDLFYYLMSIAAPSCGPSMVELCKGSVKSSTETDNYHFKFSIDPNPVESVDERTEEEKSNSLRDTKNLKFHHRSELPKGDFFALRHLNEEFGPVRGKRQRFRLLSAIRSSGLYDLSADDIELEAQNRLLAVGISMTVSHDSMQDPFKKIQVDNLLDLALSDDSISPNVLSSILFALSIRFLTSGPSSRLDKIERALMGGVSSPLAVFLRKQLAVAKLDAPSMGKCSIDELLIMISAIGYSTSYLAEQVVSTGILEEIMPIISEKGARNDKLVKSCLTAMEALFVSNVVAAETFQSIGGWDPLETRFEEEILACIQTRHMTDYSKKGLLEKIINTSSRYFRSLNTDQIQENKLETFYSLLAKILRNVHVFGGAIAEAAAMCLRQMLHYDPLQYRQMAPSGLVEAYVDVAILHKAYDWSFFQGLVPTLSAICLNDGGKYLVRSTKVLHAVADMLVDTDSLILLRDCSSIGSALEEMIRHHESMLCEVIEAVVLAAEKVSAMANGKMVIKFPVIDEDRMENMISAGISRFIQIISPLCNKNSRAAKEFVEQGGFQFLLGLVQPSSFIDSYCCTKAAASLDFFFTSFFREAQHNREYIMEVLMQEAKIGLQNLTDLFENRLDPNVCLVCTAPDESSPIVHAMSKCTVLIKALTIPGASLAADALRHALDSNLCILPNLETIVGELIHLLTLADDWRMAMDQKLLECRQSEKSSCYQEEERRGELIRDTMNRLFRAINFYYNDLRRLVRCSSEIYNSEEEALDAKKSLALIGASTIMNTFSCMDRHHNSRDNQDDCAIGQKSRFLIRFCRMMSAIVFGRSRRIPCPYMLNCLVEHSVWLLVLREFKWCEKICLDTFRDFRPALKEMKEQERFLENTGFIRDTKMSPLTWQNAAATSCNHAVLAIMGIIEYGSSLHAFQNDSASRDGYSFDLFPIPPWRQESNIRPTPVERLMSQTRESVNNFVKLHVLDLAKYPLQVAKFSRILANINTNFANLTEDARKLLLSVQCEELDSNLVTRLSALGFGTDKAKLALSRVGNDLDKALEFLEGRVNMLKYPYEASSSTCMRMLDGSQRYFLKKRSIKSTELQVHLYDIASHELQSELKYQELRLISNQIPDQNGILEVCASLCSVHSSSVFDIGELILQLYGERDDDINHLASFFIDLLGRARAEMQDLEALREGCFGEMSRFNGPLQLLAVILTKSTALLDKSRSQNKFIIEAILNFLREWRNLVKRTPASAQSIPLVPKAVDSCLLSLASAFECHYKPLFVQKLRSDKDPVEDGALAQSPLELAASKVSELLPPVDQSSADSMTEAATVALDVLRCSILYVESPHLQLGKDDSENSYMPCPRSSTEAALELLKTVCKHRKSAELVLSEQGHQTILHLPAVLTSQPVDNLISAILRHLVEEPSVLQAAMEASIRSTMTKKGGIFNYSSGKDQPIPLRQFMASFSSLACRNSEIFISAMKSTCTFKKEGKKILVSLSKPQEAEKNNDQAGVTPPGKPSSSKCVQTISSAKKQNKKIASCILNVVDALIGRMLCLVRCMKLLVDTGSKNPLETRREIINQLGISEDKEASSESYILSQQILCLSTMTELLQCFSGCVSAFLRRDADPIKNWTNEDPDAWLQSFFGSYSKKDKFAKRSKGKEKDTSTNLGLESESRCFLVAQIIGHQISHNFALPAALRENVSRQACYLLSTLSQRSLEGQKRVIHQITRILTSWSHDKSSPQPRKDFRNIDKTSGKEVTANVEGALSLLSFLILSQWRTEEIIKQQNGLIDAFLESGIVKILADILPNMQMQLNGTGMERNKILATVLIRTLEKLTSVCLRKQQAITEPGGESDLSHFMSHLNQSRWDQENPTESDEEHDTDEEQMEIDSSDINETDDEEVYSSGISSHEDDWSQDSPSQSISEEDQEPIVVQLDDSSDQSMENPVSDDEADESEEDEDIIIEYDSDDILPAEELNWGVVNNTWRGYSRSFSLEPESLADDIIGFTRHRDREEADEDVDGLEDYYEEDEEEIDEVPLFVFDDDERLSSEHQLLCNRLPAFWSQEESLRGTGSPNLERDPEFGTAFLSPRHLPVSHSRQDPLIRPARAALPQSSINHRLVNPLSAHGSRINDARPLGHTHHWLSHRYPRYGQWTILSGRRDPLSSRHRPRLWNISTSMVDEPLQPAIADSFAGAVEDAVSSRLGLRRDTIFTQPQSRIEADRELLDQVNLTFNSGFNSGNDVLNFEQARAASPPFFRPRQRQRRDNDDQADQGTRLREILASLRQENLREARSGELHGNFSVGQQQAGDGVQGTTVTAHNQGDNDSQEQDDLEPIDPEFLAALPPDIQQEVLENHEQERQSRRRARAAANRPGGASDALISELLSNIPEDLQDEALLSIDAAFGERTVPPANNGNNNHNTTNDGVAFEGEVLPRTPINLPYAHSDFEEEIESDEDLFNGNLHGRLVNERRRRPTQFMGREAVGVERMLFELTSSRPRLRETGNLLRAHDDIKPILDADQIPHLLRLLSIPKWEGRALLNRTMRNLCESRELAKSIFCQILCLLRCPISTSEQSFDLLRDEIVKSKYPSPDTLMFLNQQVVETSGSKIAVKSFGFESTNDETNDGVLDASVVRRLLELLRNIIVPRTINVILELDVKSVYETFHLSKMDSSTCIKEKGTAIQALMVLITVPLREEIARTPATRGLALEVVHKFLSHFDRIEKELAEKEDLLRAKNADLINSANEVTRREMIEEEIRILCQEADALKEKALSHRNALQAISGDVIRAYVMMLSFEGLKDNEIVCIGSIVQTFAALDLAHWRTVLEAVMLLFDFLSLEACLELGELVNASNMSINNPKFWKTNSAGQKLYRYVHLLAEGIFQLVVERFHSKPPSLPEYSVCARTVASESLEKLVENTSEGLWDRFYAAADSVELSLVQSGETNAVKGITPAIELLKPYVESYFLLHDTFRCSVCSLEELEMELHSLNEEADAWTTSRQDISQAAQRQTASFTRNQSIEQSNQHSSSLRKRREEDDQPLVSSEEVFFKFAEHHRRLINNIVAQDSSVLSESMNILLKYPRLLDFDNKRIYFRKRVQSYTRRMGYTNRLALNVRRPHVFEDSFNQLRSVSKAQIRSPLRVTFSGEDGVDAGGVTREWYQVMSREMFNPAISLFESTPQGSSTYQPNPNSIVQTDESRGISHLDYFKFVGHVVGKALLDDQVVDVHFTRSFYKHLLGMPLTYRDIEAVDPDFFKNLQWMLDNDIDGVLDLTFSEESDFFGQKSLVELCPNGASVKVTNSNKRDYVDAIARHRMTTAIRPQIDAFLQGFWTVIPRVWLEIFNDHELELMISGLPDVDIADLKLHCEYHGGYTATSTVIMWFWEVAVAMDQEDRALLLQFVTGTSKVPVGGFGELQALSGRQKFQIHKAFGDTDRLPTAHTCFNQLDLPEYESKERLRERLFMAIHEGKEGFGLA